MTRLKMKLASSYYRIWTILNDLCPAQKFMPSYGFLITTPQALNGLSFARNAMEFASLGYILEQKLIAEQKVIGAVSLNLYSKAIELALKSLALRAGATVDDCKDKGHKISGMISLIQKHNIKIPEHLDRKLNDDKSFKNRLLGTRYPVFDPDEVITYHQNYPEMIAEILEIHCPIPLQFTSGSALAELRMLIADLKKVA
jgi:hypothetical protein